MTITMGKSVPEWDETATITMANNLYTYKGCKLSLDVLEHNRYYAGKNWEEREYWRGDLYRKYCKLLEKYLNDKFKVYYDIFYKYVTDNNINPTVLFKTNCNCSLAMTDMLCGKCRRSNEDIFTAIDGQCKTICPDIAPLLKLKHYVLNETAELDVVQMSAMKRTLPKSVTEKINALWREATDDAALPLESDAYLFCNGKLQLHTTPVILILTKPNCVLDALFERQQNKNICVNAATEYELVAPVALPMPTKATFVNEIVSEETAADTAATAAVYVKRERITHSQWVAKQNIAWIEKQSPDWIAQQEQSWVAYKKKIPTVQYYECKKQFNLTTYELVDTPQFVYVYTLELYESQFDFANIFANNELLAFVLE